MSLRVARGVVLLMALPVNSGSALGSIAAMVIRNYGCQKPSDFVEIDHNMTYSCGKLRILAKDISISIRLLNLLEHSLLQRRHLQRERQGHRWPPVKVRTLRMLYLDFSFSGHESQVDTGGPIMQRRTRIFKLRGNSLSLSLSRENLSKVMGESRKLEASELFFLACIDKLRPYQCSTFCRFPHHGAFSPTSKHCLL